MTEERVSYPAYTAKFKCGCKKKRYKQEKVAQFEADRISKESGKPMKAYKCSGFECWHLTSSGAHPSSLSRARQIALFIRDNKQVTRGELYEYMGVARDTNAHTKVSRFISIMGKAGLIEAGPEILIAIDPQGLDRVISYGFTRYLEQNHPHLARKRQTRSRTKNNPDD